MKIYLAADHAGFFLKEKIKEWLSQEKYDVEDMGAYSFNKNDDYPDFIKLAAQGVAANNDSMGVVLGKSGVGEAIVANKVKGIRAGLCFEEKNVRLAREHNDINVLSLGEEFTDFEKAKKLINVFLNTLFSNEERHLRRLKKIEDLE